MNSANYESSHGQILSSLQTLLSVNLLGSEAGSSPGVPTVVPVLASQVVVTDLAAPMLAEPVSQQSVTMTQITSTLVRLLQWAWHPSHRLLAIGLSHHGCRQVRDDHLAGKDRHNYGHEMTLSGPPVSLPSRLTENTVWSEDGIWPGLDS